MPPVTAHLILLHLLLFLASSPASAVSFTCAKRSTCQPAIGYVVPNAMTYEQLISRFRPTNLHDLLAANQLPPDTAAKQAIPKRTTLNIPFRCRCTGNGVGQSDLYTVKTGTGDDDDLEILTANNIQAANYNDQLLIHATGQKQRLPCSCDKVDGSDVMHFAYIVRAGDNSTFEIAARYGVPESTLLRLNSITNHSSIRRGQILDIPLQGMGTWSRVHYFSGYRKRSLVGLDIHIPHKKTPTFSNGAKSNEENGKTLAKILSAIWYFVITILVVILLSLLLGTCYNWLSAVKSLSSRTTTGVMFDYRDLDRATNGFSEKSMIGRGSFGEVYRATYKGQEMAVKKLNPTTKIEEIHAELEAVSKTTHTNLVRLKGWCGKIRLSH